VTGFVKLDVDGEARSSLDVGDDDLRAALIQFGDDPVAVEALSASSAPNFHAFDQRRDAPVSKLCPGKQNEADQIAGSASVSTRILVVQPPLDLPMACSEGPPFAPCPCGEP